MHHLDLSAFHVQAAHSAGTPRAEAEYQQGPDGVTVDAPALAEAAGDLNAHGRQAINTLEAATASAGTPARMLRRGVTQRNKSME